MLLPLIALIFLSVYFSFNDVSECLGLETDRTNNKNSFDLSKNDKSNPTNNLTYINETLGINFIYPDSWNHVYRYEGGIPHEYFYHNNALLHNSLFSGYHHDHHVIFF
ncbi:hypothetical protein NMY3_01218 [Candidatus Nitrosocosmicus oleophilus]|uniref:Uncharacterized protein n=1 Tax=Candidatus Nitrosocosmicus oleophilus TaxID=1353260 RepID=A0A654LYK4_9ARCH|nr:hypothetical protein NMY3_01218 [Candidatus Nitrosocosmicus oleophilus]